MVKVTVKISEHHGGLKGLIERIASLGQEHIYVGVPQEKSSRQGEEINNAELVYIHTHGIRKKSMIEEMNANMERGMKYSKAYELYIHSHGSPLWHSPPRPIIEPAIEANKDKIARAFAKVYKAKADGDNEEAKQAMIRTGLTAQNVARGWFTDPRNNWAPNSPRTIAMKGSERPLIDTGELRKSIVYVIRRR